MKNKYIHYGLFIISILLFFYSQNNLLQVTRYKIIDENIPIEFNDYKIIQILDYHNTKSKILNQKICDHSFNLYTLCVEEFIFIYEN